MSAFNRAVVQTLEHEGGFVDHSSDPGGATNWGVSLRALRSLEGASLGDWDFDGDGDIDADDLKLMTVDQAVDFYRKYFWYPELDKLPQALACKVFDIGVNTGVRQAARILQRATAKFKPSLVIDGLIGPNTLAAVSEHFSAHLLRDVAAEQARFYYDLVNAKRGREVFLVGWLRRAYWMPK